MQHCLMERQLVAESHHDHSRGRRTEALVEELESKFVKGKIYFGSELSKR